MGRHQTFLMFGLLTPLASLTPLGLMAEPAYAEAAVTPASGVSPAASQNRGPQHRRGPMHDWHGNMGNTPGWSWMTAEERSTYQRQMRQARTPEACHSLMEQHHAEMLERAKARGKSQPDAPPAETCAPLHNAPKAKK